MPYSGFITVKTLLPYYLSVAKYHYIMKNFAITLNNLGETERAIALWNEAQGYEKKD